MDIRFSRALAGLVGSVFFYLTLAAAPAAAQDNSDGRYRPDGRQLAGQVAREFGERLYEVRTYDPDVGSEAFASARIFYPLTLSFAAPIGAVALVPGFRAAGENYEWWGPMLASFGYAVMILDTNQPNDGLAARKDALRAAVEFLQAENTASGSPLAGKLDTSKIAIMGHSMGGGAALHAATELGSVVKAVIPLLPYCCEPGQTFSGDFSGLSVPTLIIASAEDTVAPPEQHAHLLYQSVAEGTPRLYLEFAQGDHMLATNSGTDLASVGRYAMAWLRLHLDGQARYGESLFATQQGDYAEKFSRYEYNQ